MADGGRKGTIRVGAAWVAGTTAGLAVGGFILHFPGSFGDLAAWDSTALIFGAILGFITGVAVGLVQWAALLLRRHEGSRLLVWMGIGIAVTHGLHDAAPGSSGLVPIACVSGLAMAAAYAWSFRDRRPTPLLAIGVAWAVALVAADVVTNWVGLPWEETPVGWSTDHAFDGLIVGLIWGISTALVGVPDRLRPPDVVMAQALEAPSSVS